MTFRVVYNCRSHTWENGKYTDNDDFTIYAEDCKVTKNDNGTLDIYTKTIGLTVTREELDQLYDQIKKAIWDCNDTRGYHE